MPSSAEKKVGSLEGHTLAHTSPFFEKRTEAIESYRQKECIDAILQKDFEKLQKISEEDCVDMHHVMETSDPPLRYLTEETHRIVREIKSFRASEHIPVLFTMDAGPTVHLVCTEEAVKSVRDLASAMKSSRIIEAKVGSGVQVVKIRHAERKELMQSMSE